MPAFFSIVNLGNSIASSVRKQAGLK